MLMTYFFTILLGIYSALVTLVYLRFRKNKLLKGFEVVTEGIKWILWVAFWFIPPILLLDQYSPKEGRFVLFILWFIPSTIVIFIKGREAWERGEWEHQLRKKEAQKNHEL